MDEPQIAAELERRAEIIADASYERKSTSITVPIEFVDQMNLLLSEKVVNDGLSDKITRTHILVAALQIYLEGNDKPANLVHRGSESLSLASELGAD